MKNYQHLKDQFDRDGYAVLEDALTPEQTESLAAGLKRKVAAGPVVNETGLPGCQKENRGDHMVVVYQGTVVPEVNFSYGLPHITEATSAIVGADWHFHGDSNIFVTPGHGGRQGWHQDTCDMGPGIFFVNRIFFPWTLEPDQGPLTLVPGSHLRGELPPGGQHESIEGEIEVTPKAGSLVFMCSRVWHRVGINRSDIPRINVNFRARPWAAPREIDGGGFRNYKWNREGGKPVLVPRAA